MALRLRWKDLHPHSRDSSMGVLSTIGKGRKLRHIAVKASNHTRLMAYQACRCQADVLDLPWSW